MTAPKVMCAHAEMVAIESVIPNKRNPNRHPEAQIALLAKIIEAQGWRAPITISNRSGFIVRGHGRLEAALLLGLKEVPVDRQDYATEADEWADMLADNRLAELAETDFTTLADVLVELDTGDFDMDLTGYLEDDLARVMTALHTDEVDKPPTDPKTITCPECGHVFEQGVSVSVGLEEVRQ